MTSTSKKSSSPPTSSAKSYLVRKGKKPDIIEVHWVDAQTSGGTEWLDNDEMKAAARAKLPCMYSVGYMIHEDENQIAIVSMLGPNESSQVHKIPKAMIVMQRIINDGTG